MSIYYTGCANTIVPPSCSDCPPKELGGVRSVWFQKSTYTWADITDPSEWASAIANGDVFIIPKTRGSLDISPLTSAGFGDNSESVDGFEFTLNVVDPNYDDNCAFWTSVRPNLSLLVGYRTETKVHLSSKTAAIAPMAPVQEDIKTGVFWTATAKWVQEDPVCPQAMPTGVFDACIAVTP